MPAQLSGQRATLVVAAMLIHPWAVKPLLPVAQPLLLVAQPLLLVVHPLLQVAQPLLPVVSLQPVVMDKSQSRPQALGMEGTYTLFHA